MRFPNYAPHQYPGPNPNNIAYSRAHEGADPRTNIGAQRCPNSGADFEADAEAYSSANGATNGFPIVLSNPVAYSSADIPANAPAHATPIARPNSNPNAATYTRTELCADAEPLAAPYLKSDFGPELCADGTANFSSNEATDDSSVIFSDFIADASADVTANPWANVSPVVRSNSNTNAATDTRAELCADTDPLSVPHLKSDTGRRRGHGRSTRRFVHDAAK